MFLRGLWPQGWNQGGPPTEGGFLPLGRVRPTAQGESKVLVSCGPRKEVISKYGWYRMGPTFRLEGTSCPPSPAQSACLSFGRDREG